MMGLMKSIEVKKMNKEIEKVVETEFPKKAGSGSGTSTAYSVEARTKGSPKMIGKHIFTKEWIRINFGKTGNGVPNNHRDPLARDHDLLTFEAAQALRWWFASEAGANLYAIETRLVKHVITYEYEIKAVGDTDLIDMMTV